MVAMCNSFDHDRGIRKVRRLTITVVRSMPAHVGISGMLRASQPLMDKI